MSEESGLPPLPWWQGSESRRAARAERRRARHDAREIRRGRDSQAREPVTPDRLGDAALRIVDEEGLDALTVRRLAQELGVGTMTLYWYVQNKDEVLDLVADRIVAGIVLPPPGSDWRAAVRDIATAVRGALLRHAGAVPVMLSRGTLGPNGLQLIEQSLAILREAGFSAEAAADAYYAVSNYILGTCAAQVSTLTPPGRPDLDRRTYGQMVREYVDSLPESRYGNLRAAAPRIFSASYDERFAFGLDALVEGLAWQLDSVAGTSAPR